MTTTSPITLLAPRLLHVHPAVQSLHLLPDDSPTFTAIVDSMRERGFDPDKPITITPDHQIMDGRHRWRAAKIAAISAVPCVIRPESDLATIVLSSIIARKHFTKSAIAFECYPLLAVAHQEARQRKINQLRQGSDCPAGKVGWPTTISDLAAQLGISRELFHQAAKVHEIFAQDPEYAAQMLPRIFAEPVGGEHEANRPIGLGAVIAGWSGRGKTKDQPRPVNLNKQLDLFHASFQALKSAGKVWPKIEPRQQELVLDSFRRTAAAIPSDLRAEMVRVLTSIDD